MSKTSRTSEKTENVRVDRENSAGPAGLAISPPPYGIDFLDSQIARTEAQRLPDTLRAGLENLSNLPFADVRVNYDSDRPARFGALAYAQGTEIHLGPGQERHLPHEAWHVVQQRQGRVSPDGQVLGVSINQQPGLEAEADAMGRRAEQVGQGLSPAFLRPAGAEPGRASLAPPVVQRLVAQIVPRGNDYVIDGVVIIGRPEKVFGNSMGDHTTAFAVHAEGLKLKLAGKTFDQAIQVMNSLDDEARKLPGWKLMEKTYALKTEQEKTGVFVFGKDVVPEGHYTKAKKAFDHLNTVRQGFASPTGVAVDPGKQALNLQKYVNAYLEFRELIPLSAINVMAKSPALAGKGKGESGFVNVLLRHESGQETVAQTDLQQAILGLLDTKGVAMVAAEQEEAMLLQMAPGLHAGDSMVDRLGLVAEQHVKSIHMMFPKSLADAWPGTTQEAIRDGIAKSIIPLMNEELEKTVSNHYKLISTLKGEMIRAENEIPHLPYGSKAEKAKYLHKANQKAKKIIELHDSIISIRKLLAIDDSDQNKELKKAAEQAKADFIASRTPKAAVDDKTKGSRGSGRNPRVAAMQEAAKKKRLEQDLARRTGAKPSPAKKKKTAAKSAEPEKTESPETEKKSESVMELAPALSKEEKTTEAVAEEEKKLEEEERKQTLGTQLFLSDDLKISKIESAGRPPSPISGTMGAHTTAWIVHVDRVRKALVGKTVDQAIYAMENDLAPEAIKMSGKVGAKFDFFGAQHQFNFILYGSKLDNHPKTIKTAPDALKPLLLQNYVNDLLTYINYIPGATLEAADTGGKGEGVNRRVLLEHENGTAQHSAQELASAIKGLADLHHEWMTREAKSALWKNHLEIIKKTYPRSYAAAKSRL